MINTMYLTALRRVSDFNLPLNRILTSWLHLAPAALPRPLVSDEPEQTEANDKDVDRAEEMRLVRIPLEFKLHRLQHGPDQLVVLSQQDAALYYRQLQTIRHLEGAAAQLYKERLVRGFCHLYTGQEACAVGLCAALREADNLIAGYRIHGLAYLMGISLASVLAELLGRASGCARGKGGSMHMYARRFYGGNGIVGAQVPLGAGIALASKYRKDGGACLALYGDGAANQGQIFECFNMAQLWQLPIVFVCENNNYGMGTSASRASSNTDYYTRGDFLPGIWVDGQDVLAVRSATRFALDYARTRGPLLLELCTYRYVGHSMSDPGTSYRRHEEVQEVRRRQDAIKRFHKLCLEQALLTQMELLKIQHDVRCELHAAVQLAKSDAELPLSHLCSDVYACSDAEAKVRGILGHNLEHTRTQPEQTIVG